MAKVPLSHAVATRGCTAAAIRVQVDFDTLGGLEIAATQTWRVSFFPCITQTIGNMIKKSENSKKKEKFEKRFFLYFRD